MSPRRVPTGDVWLPDIDPPGQWIHQAACRDQDPDIWFPERGDHATLAKTICNSCPVQDACLDYALRWHIPHGIWGGLNHKQRRQLQPITPPQPRPKPGHGNPGRYRSGCRCDGCREAHRAETARYRQTAKERQVTTYELRNHLRNHHNIRLRGANYNSLLAIHDGEHHHDQDHTHDTHTDAA